MSAIGLPLTRPDGPAKVTGAARYVADTPVGGLTHAALVMSSIPAGRVTAIDTAAALAAAGVLAVITHENAPRVAPLPNTSGPFQVLQRDAEYTCCDFSSSGYKVVIALACLLGPHAKCA